MTDRPEGETRGERVRQWILGVAVVLAILGLATTLLFAAITYTAGNDHHAATVRENAEIVSLLKEVKNAQEDGHAKLDDLNTIEKQVADVIEGLPGADAALGKFAQWLEVCVGQDHETGCPAPPIPTS